MKYILCYGDSNTWGCIPQTVQRYDFPVRFTGVMQKELGQGCHIYENAVNGRTTVFNDPIEEGRCGKEGFPVVLESCSPLDLVIIMLGTNDCKSRFSLKAWDIGWGMELLINYVKRGNYGRDLTPPKILIVSPPKMGNQWQNTILGTVFDEESNERCRDLPDMYRAIATRSGVSFFDAALLVEGGEDCIHLSAESHNTLGKALAQEARKILLID